jgi:AcrR family transcriptional regulator
VEGPLTAEAILEATEKVLRRHGPAKATVLDVARALGVSHGSVYRHFPSKAALRGAVTERWLLRAHAGLAEIAGESGPAGDRLARWSHALFEAKRHKALDDPELFATYSVLTAEHAAVTEQHLAELVVQLTRIIRDGVATGEFTAADPARAARALFAATISFHDPRYAESWRAPDIEQAHDAVLDLVLSGLRSRG